MNAPRVYAIRHGSQNPTGDDVVTLADLADARHFAVGTCLVYPRPYHRSWWRNLARRITWWRQHRARVNAVDVESGTITLQSLRWSWRRWQWAVRSWAGEARG